MNSYDLVCKIYLEADYYHAPFERIEANNPNEAKQKYIKIHPETEYINILCRKSRQGSYDFI